MTKLKKHLLLTVMFIAVLVVWVGTAKIIQITLGIGCAASIFIGWLMLAFTVALFAIFVR